MSKQGDDTTPRPRIARSDTLSVPLQTNSEPPLARARRELDAIMDISRAVSTTLHIDALLPKIMERTTQLMKADRSTLFVVDAEKGELWSKVLQGKEPETIRLRIGDGIAGWVAEHGQTVNLPDAYDDARFDRKWDQKSGYRTRSLLCVPIRDKEGVVVAVIQCLNKEKRAFDLEDEHLLSCIGYQCAVAIENAFLYESLVDKNQELLAAEAELVRANAELQVLYDMEQQIAAAPELSAMLAIVLERTRAAMKVRSAALLLATESGGQVHRLVADAAVPTISTTTLDQATTQSLLDHGRFPIVRTPDAGGGVADVLLPADPASPVRETWSAPLSDGRAQIGLLQVVNRLPGHSHDVDDTGMLRLLSLICGQLARGISVRREREAGERAERLTLLGHSLGAILHDMRTPLTAVGGYTELMADEDSATTRREHAARIGRALEHMERMTQEVLAFARGQREVLIGKVYLHKFVEEVRELLVPETERFGVSLEVDAKYDGSARFDEGKLKRVIFNLARNACQAMGRGGSFRWTIDRAGEALVFECADTGPGIPKEMEGRMFESFATHGKTEGTGLGLAMAKKIVDAHCGKISVTSVPGRGATFRIEIPL